MKVFGPPTLPPIRPPRGGAPCSLPSPPFPPNRLPAGGGRSFAVGLRAPMLPRRPPPAAGGLVCGRCGHGFHSKRCSRAQRKGASPHNTAFRLICSARKGAGAPCRASRKCPMADDGDEIIIVRWPETGRSVVAPNLRALGTSRPPPGFAVLPGRSS